MRRASFFFLFVTVSFLVISGCGNIEGLSLPYTASPRVEVQTPASPAEGNITISFQLIDREVEPADVTVEYSTNGGTTYSTATLTIPGDANNLASAWHPGITHSVTWNSVTDMVGRSGAVSVCVKITPSDASNPSGTPGISGSFTVNNIAYNEAPAATAATPAGVQTGNIQINYFLADVESDTCSITVLYSTNGGTSYQAATMGPAGDGVSGLSSSPSGTAHVYLWDSRADNVAPSGQVDTIRIRITPTDFNAGTAGDTNSFSVDNSVANDPPTVAITGGPADGSTVTTTQVTFTWSGSDTDGSVVGYYYSFDHDPPDVWTTDTTVTSGALSEAAHIFRVVAVDDDSDLSSVASRSFTVSIPGTITAQFSGTPLSGTAPLTVNFTDLSTSTNGIDTWSWDFGDSETSTQEDPSHQYISAGSYTVSLTVTGTDGTDTETKTNYITVSGPGGDTIYVDGVGGDDGRDGLSWATSVQTIQTGLDKAASGWTVLVANGTYTGALNKDLDFTGKSIHLKSVGGAWSCIIDCQSSGHGFNFTNGETNASVVEGFAVINADIAIRCVNSSPKIEYCLLVSNTASNVGGGVYCTNSTLAVTNCIIADNHAVNYGGGICCGAGADITVTNCTIVNNTAGNWSGGVDCRDASPIFNNCILWDNGTSKQIRTQTAGSIVTLNFCDYANDVDDIVGSGTVTANICKTINPLLINPGGGDYHLQPGSPCIDAGDNSLIPAGVTTDLDGNMRIYNTTVDMGTYEYGSTPSPAAYGWTRRIGGTSKEYVESICLDSSGNVYLTGSLYGTINFAEDWGSSDTKTAVGSGLNPDIFIMRIGAGGIYGWTKKIGESKPDAGTGIDTDGSDNVYVAGRFCETVNFAEDWGGTDSKTSAGGTDVFITKIDANGSYCWTHRLGGSVLYAEEIRAMCVDAAGKVYLIGTFGWNTPGYTVNFAEDWGGNDTKTSAGNRDIFVTKVNANGSYGWTRRVGGTGEDEGFGICTDQNGNIYVAGGFTDSVNFAEDWGGADTKTTPSPQDAFITKIDVNGDYCWTRRMGGELHQDVAQVLFSDPSGNVYAAGWFHGGVNFAADWGGADTKTSAGEADIFVTKIDVTGGYCWTHRMGNASMFWEKSPAMCTDDSGNVYLAGWFYQPLNFAQDWGGDETKANAGESDAFIVKIEPDGGYCWTRTIGGVDPERCYSICSAVGGDIYVAGDFGWSTSGYTVNFAEDWGGVDEKTSKGQNDIFVTKIEQP